MSVLSLCPNAHKYPQIPIQKEKGTTQGILVSCLNNRWYYTTQGLCGGTTKTLKRDRNLTLFLSFPQQRPWQAAPEDTMAKMPWIKPTPVIIVDNVMICNLSNISCMPRNKGSITHETFDQKWNNLPSLLKMDSVGYNRLGYKRCW